MRLYGAIQKVEPQDDGTVRVYGIATSEALDEQGEIVRADAIRAAIPDYMRFPALREMHQLSAAGTTLEAEVCEDGTTRIVAHVVDPDRGGQSKKSGLSRLLHWRARHTARGRQPEHCHRSRLKRDFFGRSTREPRSHF